MTFFLLTIFLLWRPLEAEGWLVRRSFASDTFTSKDHCNDLVGSSREASENCQCNNGMTFYPHEKKRCFSKGDITLLAGKCFDGFVTMDPGNTEMLNSCIMGKINGIDVWDMTENMDVFWRSNLFEDLLNHVQINEDEPGIKINMGDKKWSGLMLRVNFNCQDDVKENCMLVKLTGDRNHPIQSDELVIHSQVRSYPADETRNMVPTAQIISTQDNDESKTLIHSEKARTPIKAAENQTLLTSFSQTISSNLRPTEHFTTELPQRQPDVMLHPRCKICVDQEEEHTQTKGKSTTVITVTSCMMVVIITLIVIIMFRAMLIRKKSSCDIKKKSIHPRSWSVGSIEQLKSASEPELQITII